MPSTQSQFSSAAESRPNSRPDAQVRRYAWVRAHMRICASRVRTCECFLACIVYARSRFVCASRSIHMLLAVASRARVFTACTARCTRSSCVCTRRTVHIRPMPGAGGPRRAASPLFTFSPFEDSQLRGMLRWRRVLASMGKQLKIWGGS